MPDRVSVIVPTKDRCRLLAEALASVRALGGEDLKIELIVADNGSRDDTPSVAARYDATFVQTLVPGAAATRNDQIVLGTASNTYTTPGITSAASRAAQSGPLQVVTTDAGGNLASDGGQIFSNLNSLNNHVKLLDGGVAAAMALTGGFLPDSKKFALSANAATFNGQGALGISAYGRLNESTVFSGGVAFATAGSNKTAIGGRVGVQVAW